MQTILITGVAGFIGSNLAERLLREGHRVVGLDNLAYGLREQVPAGVEFHQADVRSPDIYPLFDQIDIVFHLAAKNCIADCQDDPVETADINVTGTANVFEAARRAKIKKMIYAESSSVYEGSKLLPTPEEDEHPQTFYAASKMATKFFAEAYSRWYGLKWTALRYFCVYGPRQDYRRTIPPLFSAFIIKLLKNERPTIYGSGEKRRDFVHVDDVNDFHLLCMQDDQTTGNVFNLGSGENYSVNEIFRIVRELLGSKLEPIYQADLPGEALTTLASIEKAKKLGWSPRVGLKDGLKSSIDFIKGEMAAGRL
ncbi:MAG TPA: NAD-dependent epimerase/dehydratase family protein [Chthoniobacterales bacterium]|jgi:nucleoside-diphosphate-sugar epimerase|nr:NAD-dependent epimerase/dehydratase family protein [Chthoniobacterales bacterium]